MNLRNEKLETKSQVSRTPSYLIRFNEIHRQKNVHRDFCTCTRKLTTENSQDLFKSLSYVTHLFWSSLSIVTHSELIPDRGLASLRKISEFSPEKFRTFGKMRKSELVESEEEGANACGKIVDPAFRRFFLERDETRARSPPFPWTPRESTDRF